MSSGREDKGSRTGCWKPFMSWKPMALTRPRMRAPPTRRRLPKRSRAVMSSEFQQYASSDCLPVVYSQCCSEKAPAETVSENESDVPSSVYLSLSMQRSARVRRTVTAATVGPSRAVPGCARYCSRRAQTARP